MPVRFTSFEAYPLSLAELARAHAAFPDLAALSAQLRAGWGGETLTVGHVTARIVAGDARQTLPAWDGRADAWFLDGFAPSTNPGMWSDAVMDAIAARSAPGARVATFTVAGAVRGGLSERERRRLKKQAV